LRDDNWLWSFNDDSFVFGSDVKFLYNFLNWLDWNHFRNIWKRNEGRKWRWSWKFAVGVVGSICAAERSFSAVFTAVSVCGSVGTAERSRSTVGAAVWAGTAILTAINIFGSIRTAKLTGPAVGTLQMLMNAYE
jgi:hypothetical protein